MLRDVPTPFLGPGTTGQSSEACPRLLKVMLSTYRSGTPKIPAKPSCCRWVSYPIGSMYAIYDNIYHQYTPNVSIYIYTIHGSYGYGCFHSHGGTSIAGGFFVHGNSHSKKWMTGGARTMVWPSMMAERETETPIETSVTPHIFHGKKPWKKPWEKKKNLRKNRSPEFSSKKTSQWSGFPEVWVDGDLHSTQSTQIFVYYFFPPPGCWFQPIQNRSCFLHPDGMKQKIWNHQPGSNTMCKLPPKNMWASTKNE